MRDSFLPAAYQISKYNQILHLKNKHKLIIREALSPYLSSGCLSNTIDIAWRTDRSWLYSFLTFSVCINRYMLSFICDFIKISKGMALGEINSEQIQPQWGFSWMHLQLKKLCFEELDDRPCQTACNFKKKENTIKFLNDGITSLVNLHKSKKTIGKNLADTAGFKISALRDVQGK